MTSPLRLSLLAIVASAIALPAAIGLAQSTPETSGRAERAIAFDIAPASMSSAVTVALDTSTTVPSDADTQQATTAAPTPSTTVPPAPTTVPAPTTTAPTTTVPPVTTTVAPATTTTTTPHAQPEARSSSPSDGGCASEVLASSNEQRRAAGIAPLADDDAIAHVARDWSDRMAARRVLEHNPDFGDQVFAARPNARTAAENVGRGYTAAAIVDEFMRSAGHRDKILGQRFTSVAVACSVDVDGGLWVTMNFWG